MKIKSASAWPCAHHGGLALFRGSWVKTYIVTPGLVSPLIILLVRSPGPCLLSTLGSLVKGYWECWVRIISEVEYTAKDYKINKEKKVGFFFFESLSQWGEPGKGGKNKQETNARVRQVVGSQESQACFKLKDTWWVGPERAERPRGVCALWHTITNTYAFHPKLRLEGKKMVTFIHRVLLILFLSLITRDKERQDVGLYGG